MKQAHDPKNSQAVRDSANQQLAALCGGELQARYYINAYLEDEIAEGKA
jgi:hypothetical protein